MEDGPKRPLCRHWAEEEEPSLTASNPSSQHRQHWSWLQSAAYGIDRDFNSVHLDVELLCHGAHQLGHPTVQLRHLQSPNRYYFDVATGLGSMDRSAHVCMGSGCSKAVPRSRLLLGDYFCIVYHAVCCIEIVIWTNDKLSISLWVQYCIKRSESHQK